MPSMSQLMLLGLGREEKIRYFTQQMLNRYFIPQPPTRLILAREAIAVLLFVCIFGGVGLVTVLGLVDCV